MAQQSPYFSIVGQQYNITINWIRHGESCANLAVGSNRDERPSKASDGYGKLENAYEKDAEYEMVDKTGTTINETHKDDIDESTTKSRSALNALSSLSDWGRGKASQLTASNLYEPNLTYIGMNHAINLGTNFFSKDGRITPANIYISSALTRTITTALLALRFVPNAVIYVVPYINEIGNVAQNVGMDWQNTGVKSLLLKKKILFIKKWLDVNWITRFDDIEIINFLITIYEIIDDAKKNALQIKDDIVKVLNCRKDTQCRETSLINLQALVLRLLQMPEISNPEDTTFSLKKSDETKYTFVMGFIKRAVTLVSNIKLFKNGPTVNFEIYDYYEKLKKTLHYKDVIPDTTISNIDFFLTDVLKIIYRDIKFTQGQQIYPTYLQKLEYTDRDPITIYAFIHGSLIRHMWKTFQQDTYQMHKHELDNMMNTAVISDNITLLKDSHIILSHDFKIIHTPEKIRSTYHNFEKYNPSVCKLQSIKGIINYSLDSVRGKDIQQQYPPDLDSTFYYTDKEHYTDDLPLVITDSYRKYLKYKQKYLNLKKHNLL